MDGNTENYSNLELPESSGSINDQIDQLLGSILMSGKFIESPTAILLGQCYHLGGLVASEMLARRAGFSSEG